MEHCSLIKKEDGGASLTRGGISLYIELKDGINFGRCCAYCKYKIKENNYGIYTCIIHKRHIFPTFTCKQFKLEDIIKQIKKEVFEDE